MWYAAALFYLLPVYRPHVTELQEITLSCRFIPSLDSHFFLFFFCEKLIASQSYWQRKDIYMSKVIYSVI